MPNRHTNAIPATRQYKPKPPELIVILFALTFISLPAAANPPLQYPDDNNQEHIRIMFYNMENLFDIDDDPSVRDEEFTVEGSKNWNYYRYRKKINDLAKVIIAVGQWDAPAVIGVCEVENYRVLHELLYETPLKTMSYGIVHENSPDQRGIDVALLYRTDKVTVNAWHIIRKTQENTWKTRDILRVEAVLNHDEHIFFYVNHWPSRYEGKQRSAPRRALMAQYLIADIDSLRSVKSEAKFFVMGDFNDTPDDESISRILNAKNPKDNIDSELLYNLSSFDAQRGLGTLVYKEINYTWWLFDQMIVAGTLLKGAGWQVKGKKNYIFNSDRLLEDNKPRRTYLGPFYKGGISDHLPIYVDLYYKKPQ